MREQVNVLVGMLIPLAARAMSVREQVNVFGGHVNTTCRKGHVHARTVESLWGGCVLIPLAEIGHVCARTVFLSWVC